MINSAHATTRSPHSTRGGYADVFNGAAELHRRRPTDASRGLSRVGLLELGARHDVPTGSKPGAGVYQRVRKTRRISIVPLDGKMARQDHADSGNPRLGQQRLHQPGWIVSE